MTVHSEHRDGVTILTIDRPERRNALDPPTMRELTAGLRAAAADRTVRCVVLTGKAPAFCAGLDLAAAAAGELPDPADNPQRLLGPEFPVPVVAAVDGPAVGGGFELALACELRVASPRAWFGLPEVTRGLVPTDTGVELTRVLPGAVAFEVALAGGRLSAERAYALGLVSQLVADPVAAAGELGQRIAEGAPRAMAHCRDLLHRSPFERGTAWEQEKRDLAAQLLSGPEAAEGTAAFGARRPPRWGSR
ncbi:enoyl-CoA hydratase [Enemella dayhoffiae]|uniref:Enoyl-CoA hydratase n=1 Tax=Enemella dayhoffiae TaxID=2016507 RepID=A0A255GLF6_9ACTN|nr:enoyl-CoA hydratase/isomerase family protein [Enemella dayhoffiae]OYO16677.1 enoyl-CoA hydratase [Enemella dayhoffiae]